MKKSFLEHVPFPFGIMSGVGMRVMIHGSDGSEDVHPLHTLFTLGECVWMLDHLTVKVLTVFLQFLTVLSSSMDLLCFPLLRSECIPKEKWSAPEFQMRLRIPTTHTLRGIVSCDFIITSL